MDDLPVSLFIHGANVYLDGGDITLAALVAEFERLQNEDRRMYVGQLCRRQYQVSDRLIDLLSAISVLTPCPRMKTVRQLEKDWQKRGKGTLSAEDMFTMIHEQFMT